MYCDATQNIEMSGKSKVLPLQYIVSAKLEENN